MKPALLIILTQFLSLAGIAQTTTNDGSWQSNGNWNATYPGSGTDGDGTLNLDGETLNFNNYITLGSTSSDVNLNVANSNFAGEFIVNDTLVIFGDVFFENKSMELTVTSNGVLIIFGDLSMNNQIYVASDGLIVATGTFTMSGSTGNNDYSGEGNVYAGAYGGNAESEIDNSGDGAGDSSFLIEDLTADGFETIEEFVGGGGTIPLPVEILYFNADAAEEVELSWATVSEVNNDFFAIERSEDGTFFYEIGAVDGHGNSNRTIEYAYSDRLAFAPVEFYRLRQVDFDGQFEYSKIVRVNTGINEERPKITIYPTTILNQTLNLSSGQPIVIKNVSLISLSGKSIEDITERLNQQSVLNYEINLSDMSRGVYIISVESTDGKKLSTRIIIQ